MMRKFITVIIFAALSVLSSNAYPEEANMLRVCIENNKPSLHLKIKGPYVIQTLHTQEVIEKSKASLKSAEVLPTNSGVMIGLKEYPIFAVRIIPSVSSNIYIDKRRFRGIVDIMRTKDMKLLVINHIDIEDYLCGVLYYEVPHYWPMETIMAQAIAARTYALYRKNQKKDCDYDLTSDTYSQVYGGKAGERWRTKWAVNLTKGKVLTFKGEIFPTYYHSICAGHTEDATFVMDVNYAPVKGRVCDYCRGAKGYDWKAIFSYKQIEERLNNYGLRCNSVMNIAEGKRNKSGRLESVEIKDSAGRKNIPSHIFRLALGANVIRSTKFDIKITPKGVIFRGQGWGHGVGMCQWGAFGMARKGYDHKEILNFYYPGSEIAKID